MSSASSSSVSLPRLLLGSLIGALIGLILLALGVVVLWRAAAPHDQAPRVEAAAAVPELEASSRPNETVKSPVPYPVVGAGASPGPQAPVEAPVRAATSIWRSIFDDAEAGAADAAAVPSPAAAPRPAPQSVPESVSRPAPRPAAPRRPPEAQRQDDSLFF